MKTSIAYSLSEYHNKYLEPFNSVVVNPEDDRLKLPYDYGITNSYFGFNTVTNLRLNSSLKKVISLCHTMFGSSMNVLECRPHYDGEYFLMPSAWSSILGHKISDPRIKIYDGHFMSLYHYSGRHVNNNQEDLILYLPVSGVKTKAEVIETLKNFEHTTVFIKPHPITAMKNPPQKWDKDSLGITMKDYGEISREHSHIQILDPSQISLQMAIDKCKYIIGTPPTSCLIEAAVRSSIHKMEKRIVATDNFEGIPEKYGMSISASPTMDEFGFVNDKTINEFVIGYENQIHSVKEAIERCLG